ncbi:AEC family transporter [Aestuariimicrobium sp. T2.26MG-19.2B]|uniref:AEC family transporter n=1 Tax=Aestuariimicrobium sp. T2.26MG-19.2B TaxID=3040679 RepID=UPI002477B2D9|nr:hypothetical protein [Aestuariimicrobium sp. T2.26MG-19.2B]CAI9409503.1 hypothetical protein AESSP_02247 [Aestuariimicrobium sp. T2.26MG-19.2B]
MQDVVIQALSLVAIIGLGQLMRRLHWVSASHFMIFSRIVLNITLPAAILTSFNRVTVPLGLLAVGLVAVALNLCQQISAFVLCRAQGRNLQAFGVLNTGSYNMGAFATPYISGFGGPSALINATLFDIGNSIVAAGWGRFWAFSIVRGRASLWATVKRLFSSTIFVLYLTVLLMQVFRLRLPEQLMHFTGTVGNANTFLAMLMIGIGLDLDLDTSQLRSAAKFLALRYSWCIAFSFASFTLLPWSHELRLTIATICFAPIASMIPGFTSELGLDVKLSAFMTSLTILVSIVVMPALVVVLS